MFSYINNSLNRKKNSYQVPTYRGHRTKRYKANLFLENLHIFIHIIELPILYNSSSPTTI